MQPSPVPGKLRILCPPVYTLQRSGPLAGSPCILWQLSTESSVHAEHPVTLFDAMRLRPQTHLVTIAGRDDPLLQWPALTYAIERANRWRLDIGLRSVMWQIETDGRLITEAMMTDARRYGLFFIISPAPREGLAGYDPLPDWLYTHPSSLALHYQVEARVDSPRHSLPCDVVARAERGPCPAVFVSGVNPRDDPRAIELVLEHGLRLSHLAGF